MLVKYTGSEDYRVLAYGDVQGGAEDEEPWVTTWAKVEGHVQDMPDEVGQRIIDQISMFRVADDDEVDQYHQYLVAQKRVAEAEAYRVERAMSDQSESSVEPEVDSGLMDEVDEATDQDDDL